ncbi:MAG: tetratricopeptide repeat protein [Cellvibrionaceae bacterium]
MTKPTTHIPALIMSTVISAILLTNGCATQKKTSSDDSNPVDTTLLPPKVDEPTPKEVPPPSKPFEIETLYALLVAEIAGNRQRYDISLGNYMQEAERTRDPGVTARAARIARFLDADQASVKMALLWSEVEPNNPEALFMATTGLSQSGRTSEAFDLSARLQKLGTRPLFLNIAADAAKVTDIQREQLLDQFNALLVEQPTDLQLLVGKGMLLEQQQKPEQALVVTRQALTIKNDDIQAAIQEARLLYQLDRPETALNTLTTLLRQYPDNQRLRLQYARLLANDDMEGAQQQFQLLSEQSPNDPDILFSLGLVAFEREDLATAEKSFSHLLRIDQQNNSAHYYLGQIEELKNNADSAIHHYQQVVKGRELLPAINRTVSIFAAKNQLENISALMDNYRQKLPSQQERLYLIEAQALARHNHLEPAENILNSAIKSSPENANLLFTRAMIKEQRGLHDAAELDFRLVIKHQPNNASALNALGYGLANRNKNLEEALKLITQALNIRPDDPAIIDSMGWVQFRLGNYEEALLRLHEAFKAFPDHEVASHLGEVLWVTGSKKEAKSIWQEGIKLNPEGTIIPNTMKRLQVVN